MSSFLKSWRRGRPGRANAPALDVVTRRIAQNIAVGKDPRSKLSPEAREAVNYVRANANTAASALGAPQN